MDCVTATNIVIFAGGTGLYPFSDLIDLLFKAKLIEENHELSNVILETDSVLKTKPFKNLKFHIHIAVNEVSELHPITLYQCNELCKSKFISCRSKVKG